MNDTTDLTHLIVDAIDIPEPEKLELLRAINRRLKETKVNILITGATGCGKSSTINALFDMEKAKVGQGVDPETMEISRYDLDNLVLFDSPGLGDGKEADQRHAKNITDKLYEKDADGKALIDLVLVILDGSTRDLGTSFELISKVILPCLKNDEKRLLVAINQADLAMKGRNWNNGENRPEPALVEFLDNKVESTKHRIKESTGVEVSVIYYAAGYKDGDKKQNPYNLAKLLVHILEHIPSKKRVVVARNINHDSEAWKINDNLADYPKEAEKSFLDSAVETIKAAAAKLWGSLQGTVIVPIADKIVEKIGTFLEQIPVEEIIKKASILLVRRFPWFR